MELDSADARWLAPTTGLILAARWPTICERELQQSSCQRDAFYPRAIRRRARRKRANVPTCKRSSAKYHHSSATLLCALKSRDFTVPSEIPNTSAISWYESSCR